MNSTSTQDPRRLRLCGGSERARHAAALAGGGEIPLATYGKLTARGPGSEALLGKRLRDLSAQMV